VPLSSGTYSVLINFASESASPPIEIAKLDQQFADIATALSTCILRDGTGNPTAAINWGGQNLTNVNALTITNATADTTSLTLSKAGSKIVLARSSDGSANFVLGSDLVGGGGFSLKNLGGTSAEIIINGGTIQLLTNSIERANITSPGVWTIHGNSTGSTTVTLTIADDIAIIAGGTVRTGIAFTSTAKFGVFCGSGAPTLTAAKGSIYLRSDGSSTSTRLYVATDSAGTWTNVTTAA
jgi:hypothetical protein